MAFLITVAVLAIYYFDPQFFSLLELKTLDLRFRSRGPIAPSGEIVLVTVDEKSLDELGRWPWPRSRLAALMDSLVKYNPKIVGFDVVWAEPDENSELKGFLDVQQKLKELKVANRELDQYLSSAIRKADTDRALAEAVGQSGRAVLGYFFNFFAQEGHHPQARSKQENLSPLSYYNLVKFTSPEAAKVSLIEADHAEVNLPVISEAAEGAGYFNIFPDLDGTVRWVPLVIHYQGKHYCPLSLVVLQKFLGNPLLSLRIAEFGVEQIRLGDVSIPTNEEGRMLINYRGPKKTFPHYSATDVIHGRLPTNALHDKIVLVGATAIGIYDIRVTPFDHVFPGLEVHANVIDSVLQQQFLHRPNWVTLFDILAVLVVGLVLGILLPQLTALWGALVAGGLFIVFIVLSLFLFQGQGVWVNMTYPTLNLGLTYLGITGYRYMTEEREKQKVRGAFQYYLSPPVIEQLLKNPDKLKLGGEKKDLTVLFSDIRGFTSFSEGMSPEGLVKFLNAYLSKMTDIVFKYDGLLDKYIGDAIMAVWGAALDQPDHARQACLTALAMVHELKALRKKWVAEGLPELNIGVGINTGPMVVGNMGSDRRFNYTVMGDSVNLGSRLEGLNKVYGTQIIVSETTWVRVEGEVLGRELDLVRVKGKGRPVKIYELLALKAEASADQKGFVQNFHSGLAAYQKGQWDGAATIFSALLTQYPHDGPSKLYAERCRTLKETSPPPDWDGVCTLTTK